MPLILTPAYFLAVTIAVIVTFAAMWIGLYKRVLWLLSTVTIVGVLWLLGLSPLGFLASAGGWVTFLLTVLIAWLIQRIAVVIQS